MGLFIDLVGRKFGRLTCIERLPNNHEKKAVFKFSCECGNIVKRVGRQVTGSVNQSCGCLRKEIDAARLTTHGRRFTKEYRIWSGMMNRCYNPNYHEKHLYSERGIRVCKRWHKFENFFEDMGLCPEGKSLDRKNDSKYYSLKKCRWATQREQHDNMRTTTRVTYLGKKYTLYELAEEFNLTYKLVRSRYTAKWSVKKIVTTPKQT